MEHFWPTFPFLVPASQGLPLWWALSWWIFQILIMGLVLTLITRWAVRVDRDLKLSSPEKQPTESPDRPVDM